MLGWGFRDGIRSLGNGYPGSCRRIWAASSRRLQSKSQRLCHFGTACLSFFFLFFSPVCSLAGSVEDLAAASLPVGTEEPVWEARGPVAFIVVPWLLNVKEDPWNKGQGDGMTATWLGYSRPKKIALNWNRLRNKSLYYTERFWGQKKQIVF